MKTKDERVDDTLDYVAAHLSDHDSDELATLVAQLPQARLSQIGSALSLGATGTKDDRTANREARRAKRALMLATSVFIEDVAYRQQEMDRVRLLSETSEADLLAELRSWFTLPNVTGRVVADHAVANIDLMPNWNNINYDASTAVRGVYNKGRGKDYEFNSYSGVVFWAYQAGAISRRFLWNKYYGLDGNHFFPIFAQNWVTEIEYGAGQALVRDNFNGGELPLEAGVAVYYVTPTKVFGHVALSIGGGQIISQNSVDPAFKDAIQPGELVAVGQMQHAETHILSIRSFWRMHYNERNGYHKLQRTPGPFWEAFPANER
jgi:hypothetical protein